MLKIYLARHGEDEDNVHHILNGRRDTPLTARGVAQANELVTRIKEYRIHFDAVYSSPLQRAYTTAEIVTDALGLTKPQILPDLTERDFGVMTGKPHSSIKELCSPDIIETDTICYFLNPEGGETFPQTIARARRLLGYIKEKHKDGNILLVTHGDYGKMIYASYYDLDWKNVLKMFHFGNSELLEMSEASSPEEAHVFRIDQHYH